MSLDFKLGDAIFEDAFTVYERAPGSWNVHSYKPARYVLPACRTGAWLGINLNVSPVYDVYGPDAVQFLNQTCVNRDFALLKEGASRHCIICNDKGQMLSDGVMIKMGENHFRTYWVAPPLAYFVSKTTLDVKGKYITDEYFYQVDGPKSLEIMEDACECNLHDLKFAHNKQVKIHGMDMVIHRLGMSGCLAYEVHGPAADANAVYKIIKQAGQKYGIEPQGFETYCTNHTQGGYPNQYIHYIYPVFPEDDPALAAFIKKPVPKYAGSASDNHDNYYMNPYDVGWGSRINFDHEFPGKKALLEISNGEHKVPVTLEWNAEDAGKIFSTQFMGSDVEPCMDITRHRDASNGQMPEGACFYCDYVYCGDEKAGLSSGRIHDYYHRRMISLGFIAPKYATEGKELKVLWGNPGERQEFIRVKVAHFPYYNEEMRNETFDVSKIPSKY